MNVAQETLGFRRAGLSPALSLLMSAFALPIPPAALSSHLHRPTERSPTIQVPEVRDQESVTPRLRCSPCNILAIASYSSRHACHWVSLIYLDQNSIAARHVFRL